jgi:hypothetical protein
LLIVTSMKRFILPAVLLAILLPVCAHAQGSAVGVTLGSGESLADGLEFSFGDTVFQAYYETTFGNDTRFRLLYGTFDTDVSVPGDEGPLLLSSSIEYVNLIGQYDFDEVYGRSALFGGVGLYRNKIDGLDSEKDWGLVVGVNTMFPVTRQFALTAEIAYHWANFEENLSALIVSGGVKIRF